MTRICRSCNRSVDAIVIKMPDTSIHYAKALCPICNKFIEWLKKPDNEGIRTQSSKFTTENLSIEICELCGRSRKKLGSRETLAIHHKTPIEENGRDEECNILVLCTPCHRMAHFLRTYMHRHLDDFYTFYNDKHGK